MDLLGIRPLLFGTAWKVLDLFMDAVMTGNEIRGDSRGRYTITRKVSCAEEGSLTQDLLAQQTWEALRMVYAKTAQLRHSLVHRRITVDTAGALMGHDEQGIELPIRLSMSEQEAFARAVARVAQAVGQAPVVDARTEADIDGWLARLSSLHSEQLGPTGLPAIIRQVIVVVYRHRESGPYLLDVPELWHDPNLASDGLADLVVEFADQPGVIATGRLEDAPKAVVELDPAAPPEWLRA